MKRSDLSSVDWLKESRKCGRTRIINDLFLEYMEYKATGIDKEIGIDMVAIKVGDND